MWKPSNTISNSILCCCPPRHSFAHSTNNNLLRELYNFSKKIVLLKVRYHYFSLYSHFFKVMVLEEISVI
jgi:hypothetical protein